MSHPRATPLTVSRGSIEIRFLGRQAPADRKAALEWSEHTLGEAAALERLASLDQVHSDRVVKAAPGRCGEGDALWTHESNLVLSVVTADCVPIVIADQGRLAIVHAGWRGIVAGIAGRSVEVLGDAHTLTAWIGPAIGPCCYEVGSDVGDAVETASGVKPVGSSENGKPLIDLQAAVAAQLVSAGVRQVTRFSLCTRCSQNELWSYRACGPGAGRNFTFAWLCDRA